MFGVRENRERIQERINWLILLQFAKLTCSKTPYILAKSKTLKWSKTTTIRRLENVLMSIRRCTKKRFLFVLGDDNRR